MSAEPVERPVDTAPPGPAPEERGDGASTGPDPGSRAAEARGFEVRRNAAVSAAIGAAASAIAIAYLWRAAGSGAVLDWVLCAVVGAMAVGFLHSLLDARTPLLVADELGLRIRLGAQWRGYPWEAIDRVLVTPRRGLLRDGRLVVQLLGVQRAVEGLEGRALRHARLNRRVYGATLAVPLGLTTRVTGEGDLGDRAAALSQGRAEVVTLLDAPGEPVRVAPAAEEAGRPVITAEPRPGTDRRPRWLRRAGEPAGAPETADGTAGDAAPVPVPADEARSSVTAPPVPVAVASTDRRVRPLARLADPVEPVVIGEFEPQPAYDPVIGPELAAARTRVGLTVDELADRTRIRPHVIESIEVDDFAPCGGDFYARGHIRTLARVLGKAPEPMLAQFEARYATAPVTAKRVFEAELATGLTGTIRGTGVRGPNWALLVGVVLLLVLAWSGVRLLAGGDGDERLEPPPPLLNGSAGLASGYGQPRTSQDPGPVATAVTAVNAGAHVEVRDGDGAVVFDGDLVMGEVARVEVDPPVTVSTDNGGAVSVVLAGREQGFLGSPDEPATRVFQRPEG